MQRQIGDAENQINCRNKFRQIVDSCQRFNWGSETEERKNAVIKRYRQLIEDLDTEIRPTDRLLTRIMSAQRPKYLITTTSSHTQQVEHSVSKFPYLPLYCFTDPYFYSTPSICMWGYYRLGPTGGGVDHSGSTCFICCPIAMPHTRPRFPGLLHDGRLWPIE